MSWTTLTRTDRGRLVAAVLANLPLPPAVTIKPWTEADFPDVQRLLQRDGGAR